MKKMKRFFSFLMVSVLLMGLATSFSGVSAARDDFASREAMASVWDGTVLSIASVETAYTFDGEGTANSPYLIESASDLAKLAANVNFNDAATSYLGKYFKLTCDININGKEWKGIGCANNDTQLFRGTFDGAGHYVYNLSLSMQQCNGLFGAAGQGATIKNIGIYKGSGNIFVSAARNGALIGVARGDITVSNCFVKANVTIHANGEVGALIGRIMNGETSDKRIIENCYYEGTFRTMSGNSLPSTEYAYGCLVGMCVDCVTEIRNCYVWATVVVDAKIANEASSINQHSVGGIVGGYVYWTATESLTVSGCQVNGTITYTNTVTDSTYTPCVAPVIGYSKGKATVTDCKVGMTVSINGTSSGDTFNAIGYADTNQTDSFQMKKDTSAKVVKAVDSSFTKYTEIDAENRIITYRGTQVKSGDNSVSVRFISTMGNIDLKEYSRIGYDVVATSAGLKWDVSGSVIYTSFIGADKTYTAADWNQTYVSALVLNGVPVNTEVIFEITPYLIGADGVTKTVGATVEVKLFADGTASGIEYKGVQ